MDDTEFEDFKRICRGRCVLILVMVFLWRERERESDGFGGWKLSVKTAGRVLGEECCQGRESDRW